MTSSLPKVARRSTQDRLTTSPLPEKETLQDANAKLRAALQMERNSLKQLRREMGVQLKQVQEEEQKKTALTVRDLKARFHFDKAKELEAQKDTLNKKFDSEFVKLTKLKDTEQKRLQKEVRKLQAELQQCTAALLQQPTGLSGTARDTFESERAKLIKENQELQGAKKHLESEVTALKEQDKRTSYDMKKLKDDHSNEFMKMKKETDIAIRKLLDELKCKDRQLSQQGVLSGSGGGGEHLSSRSKPTPDMGPPGGDSRKYNDSSLEDIPELPEQETLPPGMANWTPKISELSSKLKATEDRSKTLEDEKQRLQVRLKEMERKQRPMLEKNKKFLAKNMELSSLNRSLEDKMKDLVQENDKLKGEVQRHQRSLSRRQSAETLRELSPEDLRKELRDHHKKQVESDKTIAALKLACAEKDRRIELILHRKRKQRSSKAQNKTPGCKLVKKQGIEKAAGIKETYFGYEEADSNSVADDSEMSLSVGSSSDMLEDEDVFEEFTRQEFEANYQRLVKEHLELEKSFAVLSATNQTSGSGPEPQRQAKLRLQLQSDLSDAQSKIKDLEKLVQSQGQKENCKCKDTGWIEEKQKLTKAMRLLKEKIVEQESGDRARQFQLEELQEQNEVLEFRTLELEEQCEKLSEELGETVTFTGSGILSDTGLLQMFAEEKGMLEVNLADLKENIMQLKEEHGPRLSVDEKVCLVQYVGLVQTASSKLREFTVTVEALKTRIRQLEEEKAQILSRDQGIEADLVLEYEETRNRLLDHELKSQQLASEVESLRQAEAVHSYKESHFEKLESRYQEEIAELKRRLNSASQGREYENEVFQDKLSQLRNAEKRLCELCQENEGLKQQISELQRECVELHEQLTLQQDTLSLTESDKDGHTHPGPYLQVINLEQSDQEAAKKILELLEVKGRLSSRLKQLESESEGHADTEELRFQVEQLASAKSRLQAKVQELQDLLDDEVSHSASLQKQLSVLESSQPPIDKQVITFKVQSPESSLSSSPEDHKIIVRTSKPLESSSNNVVVMETDNNNKLLKADLDSSGHSDDKSFNEAVTRNQGVEPSAEDVRDLDKSFNEAVLRNRVTELEHQLELTGEDLRQAQSELVTLEEDSSKRIQSLEEQIQSLEENKERLSETVGDLGEIERDLRKKVETYESASSSVAEGKNAEGPEEGEVDKEYNQKLKKLAESEQNLKDRLEQMSMNETLLRERLSEVEEQLKTYESEKLTSPQSERVDELHEQITEVEHSKKQLEQELEALQKDNKELSTKMDELVNETEIQKNSLLEQLEVFKTAEAKLMEQVCILEEENTTLKEDIEKLSEKVVASEGGTEELELKLSHMRNREKGLLQVIDTLKEKLDQTTNDTATLDAEKQELMQLREKVDILLESEEKLMDKLQEKEEVELSLAASIDNYKSALDQLEKDKAERGAMEEALRQRIGELEVTMEKYEIDKEETESSHKKQMEEYEEILNVYELEKVKKNQVEESLRKTVEEYKQSLNQYELEKVEVSEKLKRLEILEEMQEGNNKLQQIANKRIIELEAAEEQLILKVKQLEANPDRDDMSMENEEQSQRLLHLQRQLAELESVVEDYEHQVREGKQEQEQLRLRLNQSEQHEESLEAKVKHLQERNEELLAAVQNMQEKVVVMQGQNLQQRALGNGQIEGKNLQLQRAQVNGHHHTVDSDEPLKVSDLECVIPEIIMPVTAEVTLKTPTEFNRDSLSLPQEDLAYRPPTPIDASTLEQMSQEEILTKIQQLQKIDTFHRMRIEDMRENLEQFRKAVEVIAVAMEADAESPVLKMKPKVRDGDFESRVNELVKSEVALKLRVLELERKEATLSKRLGDTEQALKSQQTEFSTELDDLEHRLNQAKKSEARLRTRLEYGSAESESETVVRIQELEEQLVDLETSERQLQRQVTELKSREAQLSLQLEDATAGGAIVGRDLSFSGSVGPLTSSLRQGEDKYWELVDQVRSLEASEKELKDRVEELRKEDSDQLIKKIAALERSEKGLKLKLELIEAQEASFLETVDFSMLDSPQEILKQRIRELEQMEKHLRLQVGELEKDREELHELARKDKNVIHELNVQVRELQLKEKNLKAQINRYDLEDSKMYSRLDELTDENTELKEQVEKLQVRERSLNTQLQKAQYQETEWQMTLEHAKEDMKLAENRLKKKQQELEQDRKNLREKSDEHLERISELEATESSLRQKIRNLDNSDKQLKTRISELEQEGSSSGARSSQLEGLNEMLSEKVHKLEEDKASLMYEISDLQYSKEEKERENERLLSQMKGMKSRLEDNEARKVAMQERMDEFTTKEIEMHAKLQDLERCDKEWRDRIDFLQHNEEKLRQRIRELEASVSSAENMRNLSGDYENEIEQLKNVTEFHRQESGRLEADRNLLQRKLQQYEYAKANNQMCTIPASELTELRTQVALLEATERELERLEDQEVCLKQAVTDLREGKDACGHDFELRELKEKVEEHNKTLKAHELLKEKYEETRQQLTRLQSQVKAGGVGERVQTSSKSVQVRLVEQYTLKHLSSGEIYFAMENSEEFKNALKNLGARHPQAYEDFVHLLQPTGRNVSHARVTADPVTLTKQLASSLQTGTGRQHQAEKSRPSRRRGSQGRDERPAQEDMSTSERQLWRAVEGRRSQEVSDEETDHPHWTQVEKNMSDTEEMTVTVNFEHEEGEVGSLRKTRSTESVQSVASQGSLPPPLPNMGPPSVRRSLSPGNDSYYLPSADEASEIIDEDDLHPKRLGVAGSRAKSVDRDSDFSEMTGPLTHNKKKAARSLDSIPDDSGYQETDNKILKDRIAYLEAEVKRKEEQVQDLNSKVTASPTSDSNTSEEDVQALRTKLKNKERELESQQKVTRDTRAEVGTKDSQIQALTLKLELLEKSNKKITSGVDSTPLRVALKPVTASTCSNSPAPLTGRSDTQSDTPNTEAELLKKDREIKAKSNEVDRLVQELRKWQEDCLSAKQEFSQAKDDLEKSKSQLKLYQASQDKYEEMAQKYTDLSKEHEELLVRQKPLEKASEDKRALEEVVTKLNQQLTDLEGINLDRQALQAKVKVMEKEVKQKAQTESDLCRENAQLQQLVDSLQRDNTRYRELETQYRQVTAQYKAMEEIKTKAQSMITPLRAKVLRLAQKCKTRNQLINRLVSELRKYEDGTEVLGEADRMRREEEDQDYSRPISPLTASNMGELEKQVRAVNLTSPNAVQKVQALESTSATVVSSNAPKPNDSPRLFSDSESEDLLDPKLSNGLQALKPKESKVSPAKKHSSGIHYSTQSILYNSRPIKVEEDLTAKKDANANTLKMLNPPQISYKPVTLLKSETVAIKKPQNSVPGGGVSRVQPYTGGMRTFGMLRVVKNYDPRTFSRSGHPHLELPLKEGDLVKQLAPSGDVTTETITSNSHKTQESSHNNTTTTNTTSNSRKPHRSHSLTLAHPAFASRKPTIQPALTQPHPPPHPVSRSRPSSQPALLHPPGSRNASPSFSLHGSPLLTTAPPTTCLSLPNSLRNTPVQGHFTSPSHYNTSTPGHSRPASTPLTTTTQHQQPAPPSHFQVQRIVGQDGLLLSWEPPPFDELGRSNGVTVKGYKITVDQKTSQHIPSPYMSKALLDHLDLTHTHSFTIVTLGDSSLSSVPMHTSFTDILSPDHIRDLDSRSLPETSMDSGTSSGERRVFMAVYDYDAKLLSPNKNKNEELSFKTGDVVICYGNSRDDGYYFGKVHGKKGLVPASFIEEVAVFGSKSKRSHSSGSYTLSPRIPPSSASSQSVERTQRVI